MAWTRVGAVLVLLASPVWSRTGEMDEKVARKLFVEIETLARAPKVQQAPRVPWLYRDAFPRLDRSRASGLAFFDFAFRRDAEKRTPEQQADAILADKRAGWPWLVVSARERTAQILRKHLVTLRPLVEADLRSRDKGEVRRALRSLCAVPQRELFGHVLAVFKGGGGMSELASYALRELADPRAIPHLVGQDPEGLTQHCGVLRSLQKGRPAHPSLVRLLSSKDAAVRSQAAHALAESGDPSLIPHVERLVKDAEPDVRQNAANIGLCLPGKAFALVRPALLPLLADPDAGVRLFAAVCFAERKDSGCAKALLALIVDESIGELPHSRVHQAIHTLTGSYFGYYHGSDGWRPTTARNRAAIARFAQWARDHAQPR